jgi:NYN domain
MMKSRASQIRIFRGLSIEGRSIHLVDVENLAGSSAACLGGVAELRWRYEAAADVGLMDHLVIATGAVAAPAAWFDWSTARRLVRRGINGADHALLGVITSENLAGRFERVVIASGDGIFADACARLQATGCHVTVVTRPEALSTRLRLAVRDIRYLRQTPAEPALANRAA